MATKMYKVQKPYKRKGNLYHYIIKGVSNYSKNLDKRKTASIKRYKTNVKEIVNSSVVQQMKQFNHHSHTSCFTHSVHVSYMNYVVCNKLNLDSYAAAKAGLLHDLFLYDWHQYKTKKDERLHGFEHPNKALKNAHKYFNLTKKEGDIIVKHMFPLTLTLPSYKETFVIVMTDKICSVGEVLDRYLRK